MREYGSPSGTLQRPLLELLPVDAAAVVLVELRKEHLRDRIPAGHWGGRSAR